MFTRYNPGQYRFWFNFVVTDDYGNIVGKYQVSRTHLNFRGDSFDELDHWLQGE